MDRYDLKFVINLKLILRFEVFFVRSAMMTSEHGNYQRLESKRYTSGEKIDGGDESIRYPNQLELGKIQKISKNTQDSIESMMIN